MDSWEQVLTPPSQVDSLVKCPPVWMIVVVAFLTLACLASALMANDVLSSCSHGHLCPMFSRLRTSCVFKPFNMLLAAKRLSVANSFFFPLLVPWNSQCFVEVILYAHSQYRQLLYLVISEIGSQTLTYSSKMTRWFLTLCLTYPASTSRVQIMITTCGHK